MADTKISALPASTTPLAGTEVLPIVQSGTTKQVSVANLTAGRAISATQLTLTTGNLIVASGQGIDFSATPGTGTSELLNDYEEGTFTPVVAGTGTAGTATYATQVGRYTRIGRMVSITLYVDWSGHTGTGSCVIQGLPFASAVVAGIQYSFTISDLNGYTLSANNVMLASMNSGAQQIGLQQTPVGGGTIASALIDATASIAISGSYIV